MDIKICFIIAYFFIKVKEKIRSCDFGVWGYGDGSGLSEKGLGSATTGGSDGWCIGQIARGPVLFRKDGPCEIKKPPVEIISEWLFKLILNQN